MGSLNQFNLQVVVPILKSHFSKDLCYEILLQWYKRNTMKLSSLSHLIIVQTILNVKIKLTVSGSTLCIALYFLTRYQESFTPLMLAKIAAAVDSELFQQPSYQKAVSTILFTLVVKYKSVLMKLSDADVQLLNQIVQRCPNNVMKKTVLSKLKKIVSN
mmetsp:Transcript_5992/g.7825  ORF Transcript_5992/g.7825 Transcript_5992/m.7825 type:complete len:159 (+) Transcript_5992:187-663(+)